MGGSPSSTNYIVVYPSRLNKLGYCPRQLFFDIHIPIKPKLRVRLRLLIGKLLHSLRGLVKRGFIKEELISVEIPELGVLLVGRPDNYKTLEDHILLEEFKSTRAPSRENPYGVRAWLGDMLQAMAYSYMLSVKYSKPVKAYIVYLDGKVEIPLDKDLLFRYIDLYKYIVVHGFIADKRDKCSNKCQYIELCNQLELSTPTPNNQGVKA